MGGSGEIDVMTFRVNFSGEGATRLKERVREKLKEFMGDYTDDTLVEYVIVLLRNGRHKKEAENELNVFLEDSSNAFVAWLWDHLSSNLHLYVQPQESCEVLNARSIECKSNVIESGSKPEGLVERQFDYGGDSGKDYRSRHKREWKGLAKDQTRLPSQDIEVSKSQTDKMAHFKHEHANRPPSPVLWLQHKPSYQEELQPTKKERLCAQAAMDAPRRLLQFAVRDAVSSLRPLCSKPDSSLKRLRSVVSTLAEDSLDAHQNSKRRIVARMTTPAMSAAVKAAADAARDAVNFKCSRSVFDRLGQEKVAGNASNVNSEIIRCPELVNRRKSGPYLQTTEYEEEDAGNMLVLDGETGLDSNSSFQNDEGYEDMTDVSMRDVDVSQSVSANKDNSLMVQYSVAQNTDEISPRMRMNDQDQGNTSQKILNISVNVNTWKPPSYQDARKDNEVRNQSTLQVSEAGNGKIGTRIMDITPPASGTGSGVPNVEAQRDAKKNTPSGACAFSAVQPADDSDSRTVFINNVHFAATKDVLSRHFNRFGEVRKVVILTDAATGQPKGSAFVEFMSKEAAEFALSLNGTSFMSRILKVMRRSSAQSEAGGLLGRPLVARSVMRSASFVSRLARVPFPRGSSNMFRGRLPIKLGPRSLQWKREGSAGSSGGAGNTLNNVQSATTRNLTYVRSIAK